MTLFRREQPAAAPAAPAFAAGKPATPSGRRAASFIAEGTRFEGTISGATEVIVEGEVEGAIRVDGTVFIGPAGRVTGEVNGRSVQVGGRVAGNITGRERVELTPSASLEGNITAPRVVIAEGAFFKGGIEMTDGRTAPAAAANPRPEGSEAPREPGRSETVKPETAKPEAAKPEAAKPETARIEPKRGAHGKDHK